MTDNQLISENQIINMGVVAMDVIQNNGVALIISAGLTLILLLLGIKKYMKLINNTVCDKKTIIRGIERQKEFIAALACLPIGILGGLLLDHFFPKNPASIIFMAVFGVFSLFFFVLNRRRDHA